MNSKLSVIVPAYNKDKEVFQAINSMVNELKISKYDWEIIVVDDASRDRTLREAIKGKKFNGNTNRIKVLSYDLNQGKGFALYYGFQKSMGDLIVFADADLDLPAKNITTVLSKLIQKKSDISVGSKRHPMSKVNYPNSRRIMSSSYQLLIRSLFDLSVSDTQVGIKAFRREVLEECLPRITIKKFAFDLELLIVASSLGFKNIIESPIVLDYNFSSTINIKAIYQIFTDTWAIFYRKYFRKIYNNPQFMLHKQELALHSQKTFA